MTLSMTDNILLTVGCGFPTGVVFVCVYCVHTPHPRSQDNPHFLSFIVQNSMLISMNYFEKKRFESNHGIKLL